jgi:hypothetical protein
MSSRYWTGSHPKEDTHTTTYYVLGYALVSVVAVNETLADYHRSPWSEL